MTKLTTERLERKIKNCIEIEDVQVMLPLSAAEELLAFREAAKNPVAWVVGDEEIADFKNGREVCVMRDCDDEQLDYLPLYAAPVLPKQPDVRIAELEEKLEVADKLQDSAFRDGLKQGFSFGQTDDQGGFERCLSAYAPRGKDNG
ncbi:MAG: hypothetical protein E6995_13100 [Enterobacteriaceae bacterium]|uniref:hypothetical protein n=1 Tax=Hafnia paralvei TaxID=546367 RepID=UPI000EC234A8|nr:hypothetical protein [Hafnia paralvei]MDU1193072.1 hypothetical protein [Enterobacteriaceae bacterium]MDU1245162.1 hypothetical protein [Enterobacteriaceae bacterium]HCU16546.1 hypothetical protein [Hafnia paralvei]